MVVHDILAQFVLIQSRKIGRHRNFVQRIRKELKTISRVAYAGKDSIAIRIQPLDASRSNLIFRKTETDSNCPREPDREQILFIPN